MSAALDDQQRAVVAHPPEPLRVTGGFGSGLTRALLARAEQLRREGRRVLFLRPRTVPGLASVIVARHDARREVVADPSALIRSMLVDEGPDEWPVSRAEFRDASFAEDVTNAVLRYQASFLGREELLTHAEAAGVVEIWDALDRFTTRYLAAMTARGLIDRAGAVVAASMLLRDPETLAAARAEFDDLVVDDYQLADFGTARLLAQLVGQTGSITVAGNPDAAIGSQEGRSVKYFEAFGRRFGAADIRLSGSYRHGAQEVVDALPGRLAIDMVLSPSNVGAAVGHEWPVVAVVGPWSTARPRHRWFDLELLSGPDVPDDDEREAAWRAEERRSLAIAMTRATERTLVVRPG